MNNKNDSCRVCGDLNSETVITKTIGKWSSTYVKCKGCGVERIYPYPSPEEIDQFYNNNYTSNIWADGVNSALRYSPEYRNVVFSEYNISLNDIGLPVNSFVGKRLLDIGCAEGIFLDYLRSKGCADKDIDGYDVSEQMIKVALSKGYNAFTGSLNDIRSNTYEIVTAWDVLEHVLDSVDTIKNVRRIMVDGGFFVLETPNTGILSELFKERWAHYLPLQHVHLFNTTNLTSLLDQNGFKIINLITFGANCPKEFVQEPYKGVFDKLVKRLGIGSTMVMLCQAIG